LLLLCGLALGFAGSLAAAEQQAFDIPAGTADHSLKQFTAQSGAEVIYPAELVRDVKTPAVKGRMTPEEAVQQLLAGSVLSVKRDAASAAFIISRDPNAHRAAPVATGDRPSRDPAGGIERNETVELSPFTVTADEDVGYLAGNSLAGSRLNTRLKDTAASISVMTEEFIRDVGAYDISEALVYANNLQLNQDDEGAFGDSPGGNPTIELPQTYRVRGIPATVARNYFKWVNPTDTYNLERLEDSRGPNSILFGIGSAGGVINMATKQPKLFKSATRLGGGLGSHDSWRGTIDHNQVLLKDKLAVRVNAVWNRTNSFRHYAFRESRQVDLSAKYQLTKTTSIRAEFEHGEQDSNVPRSNVLYDFSVGAV